MMAIIFAAATPGSLVDHAIILSVQYTLAVMAQKDMKWKHVLKGPDADNAIAAFHLEEDSLLSTVLEELHPGDELYDQALKEAISGRYLLDIRRSGMWKARGIKQGFKESKITADGEGFNYYSHMVRLYTVRMAFFRPNRGTRREGIHCALC